MITEQPPGYSGKTKVIHIATADMGLRYLLLNQLMYLQDAGYEVVGISAPGPYVAELEEAGIRHVAVPMKRSIAPLDDLKNLWQIYRILQRERPAIVHTHNPKPGLLGQLAAKLAGVPVIINTLHGFYFHDGTPPFERQFYIWMERIAALCSDLILSQNPEDIQTAISEHISKPERIEHLGNGIDLERFSRAGVSEEQRRALRDSFGIRSDEQVVGFVGRLVAEKGIFELLEAAQHVRAKRPQTRFLIVGPIDHVKADALTPAVAADYDLEAHCIFTGERRDMPNLYALMDVFVLPSHREGFPRAPMEASAMEVPCIVTDIRGCREAVEHGQNGLRVPVRNAQALAAAMLHLLGDEQEAQRMGSEGRRLAEARFDEQAVFRKVAASYQRLLHEKNMSDTQERIS